jgi:hypothetical protein
MCEYHFLSQAFGWQGYKALVQKLLFTNPFQPHEERSEGLPLAHDFEIQLNSDILDA